MRVEYRIGTQSRNMMKESRRVNDAYIDFATKADDIRAQWFNKTLGQEEAIGWLQTLGFSKEGAKRSLDVYRRKHESNGSI